MSLSQVLATVGAMLGLVALIGLTYDAPELDQIVFFAEMPLPSAICLLALGRGVLHARPDGPVTSAFVGAGPGRALVRRLIPLGVVIPWGLGLVVQRLAFGPAFTLTLVVSLSGLVLTVTLVWSIRAVGRREADFETTLASIGDGVVVTDERGRITLLNAVAERLMGWPLEEARGKPIVDVFDIVNETTRAKVENPVERVLREGVVVGLANHTVLRNRRGGEIPIADSGAPVRDPRGVVRGTVLVFRDMSDEHRIQQALEQSEQDLRTLMSALPSGVVVTTPESVLYANPAMLEILGETSLEPLRAKPLLERIHPEDRAESARRGAQWKAMSSAPPPRRVRLLRSDGSPVLLVTRPVGFLSFQGKQAGLAIFERVSELEAQELRLARGSMRTSALAEMTRLLAEANLDLPQVMQRIVETTATALGDGSAVRLLSVDGKTIDKVTAAAVTTPELGPSLASFLEGNRAQPADDGFIGEVLRKNLPIAYSAEALSQSVPEAMRHLVLERLPKRVLFVPMHGSGRTIGLLSVARFESQQPFESDDLHFAQDLADRAGQAIANARLYAALQETLQERQEARLALAEAEQQQRQSQKLEAIGRLAGGVAHDFNNLLTVILSLSNLLLATRRDGDAEHAELSEIRDAGERASALTRQLLAFSRKQLMQPRLVKANEVVNELKSMLARLLGEDITLDVQLAPELPVVRADPGLLSQVVMNLALNARDAMPRGGALRVETAAVPHDETLAAELPKGAPLPTAWVVISVRDTGSGMTQEVLDRLFEPFFTTKGVGAGTGLGLSTSYGIVRQSGGHIRVHSEVGVGSTFRVFLPGAAEKAETSAVATAAPVEPKPTGTVVLLVEDEPQVRHIAKRILERGGYQLLVAESGPAALTLLDGYQGALDLLVTDVVMPGMSGRELAEAVHVKRPEVKVLFTSGYTEDEVMRHGVREGQVAFLQKPFTPDTFLAKVKQALIEPARLPTAKEP